MIGFAAGAGLAPRPITVHVHGETYTVRPALADVWLEAWARAGPERVMPAMLGNRADEYRFWRAMSRTPEGAPAFIEASRRVFGLAAGCDWWTADRLAVQSVAWAAVGGELYAQGFRPGDVPLGVWLAGAYRAMMLSVSKDERPAVEGSLALPPSGYDTGELPELDEIFTP